MALLLIAVLHVQQPDERGQDMGHDLVGRYRDLLQPGSYLAISHITDEGVPTALEGKLVELKRMYDTGSSPVIWRAHQQIRHLFGDFALVEPGMTWTPSWHPEDADPHVEPILFSSPNESVIYAGVGRKRVTVQVVGSGGVQGFPMTAEWMAS